MNRRNNFLYGVAGLTFGVGCASTPPTHLNHVDSMIPYREPAQMRPVALARADNATEMPEARPLMVGEKAATIQRPLPASDTPDSNQVPVDPAEVIEDARNHATQRPTSRSFINAVQMYDFEPGAVYEVMTVPRFVTVLRLRPGEELRHLAAGDTSRWMIDTSTSGNTDDQTTFNHSFSEKKQPLPDQVCVLIKPRRPSLETNLVITTNERTYLVDLKSVEDDAYHSVVEWTYPKPATVFPLGTHRAKHPASARDTGMRNYIYTIKTPKGAIPVWTPQAVYDDGHRVHVVFSDSITDTQRPPLFALDPDGIVRMVNYRTERNEYVVDELFERAVLRLGNERVILERTLPRPKPSAPVRN